MKEIRSYEYRSFHEVASKKPRQLTDSWYQQHLVATPHIPHALHPPVVQGWGKDITKDSLLQFILT